MPIFFAVTIPITYIILSVWEECDDPRSLNLRNRPGSSEQLETCDCLSITSLPKIVMRLKNYRVLSVDSGLFRVLVAYCSVHDSKSVAILMEVHILLKKSGCIWLCPIGLAHPDKIIGTHQATSVGFG